MFFSGWITGEERRADRVTAWLLALAGVVPFALLAASIVAVDTANPLRLMLVDGFRTYSAVILAFLGGIRWGAVLVGTPPRQHVFLIAVLPVTLAWSALFLPVILGITLLLFAFCAQGAWDSVTFHASGETVWFARLRILMTLLAAAAHLVVLLALA